MMLHALISQSSKSSLPFSSMNGINNCEKETRNCVPLLGKRLVKSMSRDNARDKIAHTCLLYDDCDDDYSCLSFRDVRVRRKSSTREKLYMLHIVLNSLRVSTNLPIS